MNGEDRNDRETQPFVPSKTRDATGLHERAKGHEEAGVDDGDPGVARDGGAQAEVSTNYQDDTPLRTGLDSKSW